MKTCPTCHRSYADDTLLYCLEDGAQLFTPRNVQETLRIPGARDTEPPATEILPHGYQPPVAPNSATWPAQNHAGAVPPTMPAAGHQPPPPQWPSPGQGQFTAAPPRRSSGPWIAVSAVLALLVLGMVGVVGIFLLSNNSQAPSANVLSNGSVVIGNDNNPYPNNTRTTNANTPNANTVATNSNTDGDSVPAAWLEGEWAGSGKQLDGGTWSMQLTANGGAYTVEYPNLKCGGRWKLVSWDSSAAVLTEVITHGSNCVSGADIKVQRLGDDQIECQWTYANTDAEVATATLSRQ
jgi:hypothetical protein